ncbi:MAG TPA: hypothetical protein VGN11_01580, partial [Candidatus Baltobacteraceae bacterium]|nr:hypothetical protein [Candidatus Baltobacteraceae bacterium]
PFIERAITKDGASHQLLDRPRDVPWRTGVGVALFVLALGLTLAGSDDVQARYLHVPIDVLTLAYRWFCIAAPLGAFFVTYAIANDLRRRGGVHQAPRVRVRRNAGGGFDEDPIG